MNRTFCGIAVLLTAPYAFSESITPAEHDKIEEVITTASPVHSDEDKIIRGISVLSGDQLRQKSAATIGETLKSELGISSSSFGPGVGAPVIRGQSAARVKVMQDSLDTLDASTTSPDHAVGNEPLLAERIEVLRGPATLRYGNGAIGGVVNVIDSRIPTEAPEKLGGGLELRHGSINDGDNAVFKLDGGSGPFAWHLDGLYRSTNNLSIDGPAQHPHDDDGDDEEMATTVGFIDNTDARAKSATVGFSWVGDDGFIGFSINRLENNYGVPSGGHEHHEDEDEEDEDEDEAVRIDLRQTRYDLKGELNEPLQGFQKLSFRLGHNDYRHVELEGEATGTRFTNDAWEGRLELLHKPWHTWQGAIGVQGLRRDFAALGEEAFVPPSDIGNYGVFWLEDLDSGDWHLELGLRAERQNIDPHNNSPVSHTTFTGSGSLQWLFAEDQHLSVSLTRAGRAPSVEELFSNGPHLATNQFIIGNSNMDTETSMNYELGYHYHGDTSFKMFLFYNNIDDFIYAQNLGFDIEELPVFQYSQQDARFKGLELELSVPLNEQLSLRLFGDYVRAEFNSGEYVPRIPPARYGSELEYQTGVWRANLLWTEVRDQGHAGDLEEPTEGYTRLDVNLSYLIRNGNADYTLFLRSGNLLNEEIRNATSFLKEIAPEAGRNIEIGIRLTF